MASLSNAIKTQRARLGRVLLAASASTLMTCVVALPMAYQAQAARSGQSVNQPATTSTTPGSTISTLPSASVLGATTIAPSETTTPSESADPQTTKPRIGPVNLRWSASPSLSTSTEVQGAVIGVDTGAIYVYLDAEIAEETTSVRFFLNGELLVSEAISRSQPLGGTSLDLTSLGSAQHTVRAEVRFAGGGLLTSEAVFWTRSN
jgi:hypothetical protein